MLNLKKALQGVVSVERAKKGQDTKCSINYPIWSTYLQSKKRDMQLCTLWTAINYLTKPYNSLSPKSLSLILKRIKNSSTTPQCQTKISKQDHTGSRTQIYTVPYRSKDTLQCPKCVSQSLNIQGNNNS